jgi:hypothetical protein
MKEYHSIPRLIDDGTLKGEYVVAFNKLDGQNFRVKYTPRGATKEQFTLFGSRNTLVNEDNEQFGEAIRFFKQNYESVLREIIVLNSGKKGIFNGAEEITLFFEWYGDNSFAGFHKEGDNLRLCLFDVFIKKKGYVDPGDFIKIFGKDSRIETPEVIYQGKLNEDFVESIQNNDWTKEGSRYPRVKEGVVIKRSTKLPGQRLPMSKVKTKWWLNQLHLRFSEEECKRLE